MTAENTQNLFVNPDVSVKLKEMWNNKEFSDTLFLVNECQFYASSHLVSVMSGVLKGIIDTHFQHCGDREIRIGEVKFDESFSVVLKFIHGIGINLEEMDKKLLCDVLYQAERFQLNSFSEELKSYLSKLDAFDIDSLIFLINTAKKFEINDLYEKLIIFAYQNADQLVKHESFVDLKYDVLSEMLKADNFFAPEIDILVGTLKWHGNNLNERGYDEELKLNFKESEEVLHVGNKTPTVVDDNASEVADKVSSQPHDKEDEEMNSDSGVAEKVSSQTHDEEMNNNSEVGENVSSQPHDEEDEEMNNASGVAEKVSSQSHDEEDEEMVLAACKISVQKASTSLISNVDSEPTSSNAVDGPNEDVVKNFSRNILKSLIIHIRGRQISVIDYFQFVSKLDTFKQYQDFLEDFSHYSQSPEARVPYV